MPPQNDQDLNTNDPNLQPQVPAAPEPFTPDLSQPAEIAPENAPLDVPITPQVSDVPEETAAPLDPAEPSQSEAAIDPTVPVAPDAPAPDAPAAPEDPAAPSSEDDDSTTPPATPVVG